MKIDREPDENIEHRPIQCKRCLHGVSSFDAIVAAFRGNAVGTLFGEKRTVTKMKQYRFEKSCKSTRKHDKIKSTVREARK